LNQPAPVLRDLKGVGPGLEQSLQKLGIHRVEDLLFHLPLRYEDRTRLYPVGSLEPGQHALIEGEVEHAAIVPGRRRMLVVVMSDGTGRISLRFFHFRYFISGISRPNNSKKACGCAASGKSRRVTRGWKLFTRATRD
jgi:ATP-dependent DNA helicase RecG